MNSLRSFYGNYPTIKIAKGDILFKQTDTPSTAYAIKRGVMRISNISSEGAERVISFKVANEPLPICWIFSKTTSALFYYIAHTDCELYVIDKADLDGQQQSNPAFMHKLLDTIVNAYVNTSLQIDALVQTRASGKLLYAFRHLCLRYGKDTLDGHMKIQIPLTQQDIANYTGLTRETTTLELNKLKAKKIISVKHKYYSVNISYLEARIDNEYNPGGKSDLQSSTKSLVI